MAESELLQEAIEAVEKGEPEEARELLTRLLKDDQNNPEYWLWMSCVVNSPQEKILCLKNADQLDSGNEMAKIGLALFEGVPEDSVEPSPFITRDWKSEVNKRYKQTHWLKRMLSNSGTRIMGIIGGLVLVGSLITFAIIKSGGVFAPQLTITPIPWTPTSSITASVTPNVPSQTPRISPTLEPLWMLLDATYTPVPKFVDTPHPRLEAYRLAMTAYEDGDFEKMIGFLEQTLEDDPESVDVNYYLGEAYRHLNDFDSAMKYFEDVIAIDQNFAPVYLSRALLRKSFNPNVNVIQDISYAIDRDPLYGAAYLERAKNWFSYQEYQKALGDLISAVEIIPSSPYVHLELAKVYLAIGERDKALESALEANNKDITHLPTYLILSEAYLANGFIADALDQISIYKSYEADNAYAFALTGVAKFKMGGDLNEILETLDRAISLDDDLAIAYYYRGLTLRKLGDARQALNDLYVARSLEPKNIEYQVLFSVGLYENERYREAYNNLDAYKNEIKSDDLLAVFYYYKGKSGFELSQFDPVKDAWTALLELPEGVVAPEWIEEAERYLSPQGDIATLEITESETLTPTITPTQNTMLTITVTPSN